MSNVRSDKNFGVGWLDECLEIVSERNHFLSRPNFLGGTAMFGCGLTIGSQLHQLVVPGSDEKPREIKNDASGVRAVIEAACGKVVLVAGNRQWAEAFCYALIYEGAQVRYIGGPEKAAGERWNGVKVLRMAFERNLPGQPFFREEKTSGPLDDREATHPWTPLANEYERINNDARRSKHRIINALRIVFPELINLEAKLWSKGALEALRSRKWDFFRKWDLHLEDSISMKVPNDRRLKAFEMLRDGLAALETVERQKDEVVSKIGAEVGEHPAVTAYNGSLSAMMVVLLTGWRKWGGTKPGWRILRSYAGFAVTRIDPKTGRGRISRKRPRIRVNLYHLLKSRRGKEVVGAALAHTGKVLTKAEAEAQSKKRMSLVEQLEYVLRDIWRLHEHGVASLPGKPMVAVTEEAVAPVAEEVID